MNARLTTTPEHAAMLRQRLIDAGVVTPCPATSELTPFAPTTGRGVLRLDDRGRDAAQRHMRQPYGGEHRGAFEEG
jgi:hypothetical protein